MRELLKLIQDWLRGQSRYASDAEIEQKIEDRLRTLIREEIDRDRRENREIEF